LPVKYHLEKIDFQLHEFQEKKIDRKTVIHKYIIEYKKVLKKRGAARISYESPEFRYNPETPFGL